jgi:hypothetical protein
LLERPEKEKHFSMAKSTFKMKMDIDRHSPRLMPNNCKNLNPPYFSLPSTFKAKKAKKSQDSPTLITLKPFYRPHEKKGKKRPEPVFVQVSHLFNCVSCIN